ncbi:hypothetical protein P153DRAFT_403210, partial [Dothidotthia symphoricarpi CBS 119687]
FCFCHLSSATLIGPLSFNYIITFPTPSISTSVNMAPFKSKNSPSPNDNINTEDLGPSDYRSDRDPSIVMHTASHRYPHLLFLGYEQSNQRIYVRVAPEQGRLRNWIYVRNDDVFNTFRFEDIKVWTQWLSEQTLKSTSKKNRAEERKLKIRQTFCQMFPHVIDRALHPTAAPIERQDMKKRNDRSDTAELPATKRQKANPVEEGMYDASTEMTVSQALEMLLAPSKAPSTREMKAIEYAILVRRFRCWKLPRSTELLYTTREYLTVIGRPVNDVDDLREYARFNHWVTTYGAASDDVEIEGHKQEQEQDQGQGQDDEQSSDSSVSDYKDGKLPEPSKHFRKRFLQEVLRRRSPSQD